MAPWVKALAAGAWCPCLIPRTCIKWKERTNSSKLTFDCHTFDTCVHALVVDRCKQDTHRVINRRIWNKTAKGKHYLICNLESERDKARFALNRALHDS